jgi:hypothetical protein
LCGVCVAQVWSPDVGVGAPAAGLPAPGPLRRRVRPPAALPRRLSPRHRTRLLAPAPKQHSRPRPPLLLRQAWWRHEAVLTRRVAGALVWRVGCRSWGRACCRASCRRWATGPPMRSPAPSSGREPPPGLYAPRHTPLPPLQCPDPGTASASHAVLFLLACVRAWVAARVPAPVLVHLLLRGTRGLVAGGGRRGTRCTMPMTTQRRTGPMTVAVARVSWLYRGGGGGGGVA